MLKKKEADTKNIIKHYGVDIDVTNHEARTLGELPWHLLEPLQKGQKV